jgi:hypothetical protein
MSADAPVYRKAKRGEVSCDKCENAHRRHWWSDKLFCKTSFRRQVVWHGMTCGNGVRKEKR